MVLWRGDSKGIEEDAKMWGRNGCKNGDGVVAWVELCIPKKEVKSECPVFRM